MDLAQEVDRLLLHHHLVHRPPHQHGTFCRKLRASNTSVLCSLKDVNYCTNIRIPTVHHQLCRVAVPLSNHIRSHTNIHASIVLPGVRDHQFATTHLQKNRTATAQEIILSGCPCVKTADRYDSELSSQPVMKK